MTSLDPLRQAASQNPCLEEDEIHVWLICLDQSALERQSLQGLLPPEESERARRFHFDHHRERFIVAHLALRLILGRYLRQRPDQLRFRSNAYGKPTLYVEGGRGGVEPFHFNLSHSEDLALLAVGGGRAVGVMSQCTAQACDSGTAQPNISFSP